MQAVAMGKQVVLGLVFTALVATLLMGCGSEELPPSCAPTNSTPTGKEVSVYFGCGCFWHEQHEFAALEMSALCRNGDNLTARAAYAGGTKVGPGGLVCYHNSENVADYGALGHSEVISLAVPESAFGAFASKFWDTCRGGDRRDPQDRGGEYRSVVGLPGGMASPFLKQLQEKAGSVKLVAGSGNEGDTLGKGKVFVYDTSTFPAHVAEKYHQFHDDMMDAYGSNYNSLRRFATSTGCPGDPKDSVVYA